MSAFGSRFLGWFRRLMPTREQLESNRVIRPLARRTELWRFTRRSVPRGVAVGMLVGIFALIPGVQIIGAALMCVPCRANIPLAVTVTFLSNPATTPFIIASSIYLGNKIGYHADLATLKSLYARGAGPGEWAGWLLSDAAPALVVGLFMIATVAAALGYLLSSWIWRAWVARKNRARLRRYMEREGEVL